MNKRCGLGLMALAVVIVGCQKSYELRFQGASVPQGQQMVKVAYSGTANIWEDACIVRNGDTSKYVFKVDEDDLPGTLTWMAGPVSGKILLDKKTSSPIYIAVDQYAPGMKAPGEDKAKQQSGQGQTVETTETVVTP